MTCEHGQPAESCPLCLGQTQLSPSDRVPAPGAPVQPELQPGQRIGRYVVLEWVGEGGMGIVYAAFDPELDRKVAIKLLRAGPSAASQPSEGKARLLREAQAMAQLSHPNVVPVYDVGALDDSVFVAMEFITGQTLSAWLRETPRPCREVVDAHLAAGAGLAAAHAAGMVHRDFKPENVLVGSDGRVRVTDFGLARSASPETRPERPQALEQSDSGKKWRSALTQVGTLVGTAGYLAPELYTGGSASFASDEFAFCVSLWEGLYGKRPFDGASTVDVAEATLSGKLPAAPRNGVPAWIHAVLLRGLSKDPAQRFPSLQALLDALGRDPARRRRWLLQRAGAVAVLATAVGAVGWMAQRQARLCAGAESALAGAWDAEARARGEAAFKATGKAFAAATWTAVEARLDAYASEWVVARTDACQATRVRREQTERQLLLRTSCLDRRLSDLRAVAQVLARADAATVEHASRTLEDLPPLRPCSDLRALEDPRQALPEKERAAVLQLEEELAEGRALTAAGHYKEARAKLEPALKEAEPLRFAPVLAEAHLGLGTLDRYGAQFATARRHIEDAASAAEAAGDDAAFAGALTRLVSLVGWPMEKPEEARSLARLAQGAVNRVGDVALQAKLDAALGDVDWESGDNQAAAADYRRALAGAPEDGALHYDLGYVLEDLAQYDASRRELERALAIRQKELGPEHPSLAPIWTALGNLETTQTRLEQAEEDYRRAIALQGADNPATLPVLSDEAHVLALLSRDDEAGEVLERMGRVIEQNPGDSNRRMLLLTRSAVLGIEGHFEDALADGKAGLALGIPVLGEGQPTMIAAAAENAEWLVGLGRHAEALEVASRALAACQAGTDPILRADVQTERGKALLGLRRWAEARAALDAALSAFDGSGGNDLDRADTAFALGRVLSESGADRGRGVALAKQALEVYRAKKRTREAAEVAAWLASGERR